MICKYYSKYTQQHEVTICQYTGYTAQRTAISYRPISHLL